MKKGVLIILLLIVCSCTVNSEEVRGAVNNERINIGVKQYLWTDRSRIDSYYNGNRIVNAQVWYPGSMTIGDTELASYYFKIDDVWEKLSNWTKGDYKLVNSIRTNSKKDLPFKQDATRCPLIIFSPSLGGNLSQYTFYAEYLVQQGYIVMGVNHLYESEYVVDTNDEIFEANLTFHDSLKTLNIPDQITADEYRAVKGVRQKVLGEDLIFSLNQLLQEPFFKNKIELNSIGAFGHSIGGAGAIYASILDDRIKAVVDLDGTPPSVALENGISIPFLFIEDLIDYKNHKGYAKLHSRRNNFCDLNKSDSWRIMIGDTNHNSFLDINYYLAENEAEREQAFGVLSKTVNYMDSFFSHYFYSEAMDFKAMKSDTLEIIYFKE